MILERNVPIVKNGLVDEERYISNIVYKKKGGETLLLVEKENQA